MRVPPCGIDEREHERRWVYDISAVDLERPQQRELPIVDRRRSLPGKAARARSSHRHGRVQSIAAA